MWLALKLELTDLIFWRSFKYWHIFHYFKYGNFKDFPRLTFPSQSPTRLDVEKMDGEQNWTVIEILDGLLSKWGRSWVKNNCLIENVHFLRQTVQIIFRWRILTKNGWKNIFPFGSWIPIYYGVVIWESVGPPCGFILINSLSWCLCIVHSVFSLFFHFFLLDLLFKNLKMKFYDFWQNEK